MTTKDTSGSAFPTDDYYDEHRIGQTKGMTLRQYAAIKLKVPDSGLEWLDIMILESRRIDAATMPTLQTHSNNIAIDSYTMTNAMLEERKK